MKHVLLALYVALGLLAVVQSLTHPFTDQSVETLDSFLLSKGLTPYVDFFEHHPVLNNFLLAPVFWLTGPSTSALVVDTFLGLVGVFFAAWLVFKIARDSRLPNPHAASLFFLVGYTSLVMPFLRYDFWSMLFLLCFFAFRHPFLRGLFIVLCCATSPIVLFAAGAVGGVYLISTFIKNKREAMLAVGGGIVSIVFWLLLHRNVPFSLLYHFIFAFNNKVASLYLTSWQEVVFFTLIFALPLLALALWQMVPRWKKSDTTATLALIFTTVFVLQIVAMNVVYGAFSRIKLPAPLPLIGLLTVFIAGYSWKRASWMVAAQLLLTLFVYTPSLAFPQLDIIGAGVTLNQCVAPDAKFALIEDPHNGILHVPLYREPAQHYWFAQYIAKAAGEPYQDAQFANATSVCQNLIERSAWTCTDAELSALQQKCDTLFIPDTLWNEFRKLVAGTQVRTR
jgi:hypothetical protein